jgi:hypothetical protein
VDRWIIQQTNDEKERTRNAMSMKKVEDVVVTTGEYEDRQTGETKKRRQRIGSIFEDTETGRRSLKLEVLPVGLPEWKGWAAIFPSDSGRGAAVRTSAPVASSAGPGGEMEEDDIPF